MSINNPVTIRVRVTNNEVAQAFNNLVTSAENASRTLRRIGLTMMVSVSGSPSSAYRLAGSPYGKNQKGKKRWWLEVKQYRKGLRDHINLSQLPPII